MTMANAAPGNAHRHDHDGSKSSKLGFMTKERRLYGVIAIAFTFLIAELVIGFTNNALVLVADAFHITSDLIGYIVSVVCIRLANQGKAGKNPREGFTFGMQRAELLGAAFNGTFLLALGVSIILQAIDRFINPSKLENAVLVAIIGGAGIASNVVMLAILGGHNHDHGKQHIPLKDFPGSNVDLIHNTHAHHTRKVVKKSKIDLNIFGVLLHVLGDALNSLAVIISAVVYLKTGWIYMDPLASLFVGIMIIGTALPLVSRSGRLLAETAPKDIDVAGVQQDVARIEGVEGVHELHVWSLNQTKALASLHLTVGSDSLTAFMKLSQSVQSCLHFWGVHAVTIQPELVVDSPPSAERQTTSGVPESLPTATSSSVNQGGKDGMESACNLRCSTQLCEETCC